MLDVADDWTFTVETVEPTIVVPVKAATAVPSSSPTTRLSLKL